MTRLHGVQYLRALAALAVVVFHAAERTGGHFTIGAAGVDVFFVVSGFIMWTISENRPVSPARFFRERLERIAPAYWAATAVMVAGGLLGLFPSMRLTLEHVLGSFLFIPHRSPSNGELWPVLVQGWTLNYEMVFYAMFAIALFLPKAFRLPALAAVFSALVGSGLLFASENPLLATYTRPIVLEFLAGCLIGRFWTTGRVPSPAAGLVLLLAVLLGFAFVGTTYVGFTEWVFGPLAVALLLGTLSLEASGAVRRLRLLAWLGDASYSIYLWHTLAISVVAKAGTFLALPAVIVLPAAIAAGTIAGLVCYELLEKPLAALLKARRDGRRAGLVGQAG